MTEPDRSAPLSVEQRAKLVADSMWPVVDWLESQEKRARATGDGGIPLSLIGEATQRMADKIADALSAAHAEGVRTGRRQALLDAADAFPHSFPMQSLSGEFLVIPEWLRGFSCAPQKHARGDEAHHDTEGPESITKAE